MKPLSDLDAITWDGIKALGEYSAGCWMGWSLERPVSNAEALPSFSVTEGQYPVPRGACLQEQSPHHSEGTS